ncbi:hypothetical protein J6590_034122 [Homalodisca vitripennis]|nr:hypothetical protein J6590_034122 [Homalodisca vitripennis]
MSIPSVYCSFPVIYRRFSKTKYGQCCNPAISRSESARSADCGQGALGVPDGTRKPLGAPHHSQPYITIKKRFCSDVPTTFCIRGWLPQFICSFVRLGHITTTVLVGCPAITNEPVYRRCSPRGTLLLFTRRWTQGKLLPLLFAVREESPVTEHPLQYSPSPSRHWQAIVKQQYPGHKVIGWALSCAGRRRYCELRLSIPGNLYQENLYQELIHFVCSGLAPYFLSKTS